MARDPALTSRIMAVRSRDTKPELALRKARGAYYTDPAVADFLVRSAVVSKIDRVLDPCFGEGVFLQAAIARVNALGGDISCQITGAEVDLHAYRATAHRLVSSGLPRHALVAGDFFDLNAAKLGRFSAVVGNPPFIRYQLFNGRKRKAALARAAEAGVRLTALTSAWAPFIIHATTFLEPDGRLAMVAPAELCHAAYARPVLDLLARRFRLVRVLTFARRLFPDLSEDTVLVVAEGYGREGHDMRLVSLPDVSILPQTVATEMEGAPIEAEVIGRRVARLISYLLPETTRGLYQRLCSHPQVVQLGDIATSGIGYVTGNNEFFHLSAAESKRLKIGASILSPAVCRAAWLAGTVFTRGDWVRLDRTGHKTRLLDLEGVRPLPKSVSAYLRAGRRQGVHLAYKCRVREPWYAVPHVTVPDLFLTYMSNTRPALAVNRAKVVAPNTLLCVSIRRGAEVSPEAFVASWWTSLAALSAEIEGHSLGGGMIKLEPGEAANIILPLPDVLRERREAIRLAAHLDRLVRREAFDEALDFGDREILSAGLALSPDDCIFLRQGFQFLMDRRRKR